MREIPGGEIMRTFKDAIDVTRALGVQYLWIDSLCIIPDSESDWFHESSIMSDIYQFSYCNIAAAHATSDAIGLFVDREPPQFPPLSFDYPKCGSNNLDQPVGDDRRGVSFRGPYWQEEYCEAWMELRDSPLYRRAWVVQEVSLTETQMTLRFLKQVYSVSCRPVHCILQVINCFGNVMSFAPVNSFQAKCHVPCGPNLVSRILLS